ncbi:MAG: DNA adenine methylase [Gammaproteobacteria bacterium]|nr:DNA adenine methylase [Gammaproteobacteria bacterium]NIR86017.1 DNA adenine methylase [Gammaproteobacteria bacterium]NIU07258.1 DNA adenine methylase [Gammaproteobacteria bacterium]NIV54063.1 DNA adenine methylase [Gammaproteobacteria bacterium]NIX88531.1 DNA adenine methylase [Gammaproteobacteria bacterium]
MTLKAPFPWFGGKRRVANVVWRAFGADCPNYVEPFAGSLAVLLGRPGGPGKIETVNDRDRYLANFWRAVTAEPDAVARWADWPVNEADLHARHRWLVNQAEFRERMHIDPDFYDVKIAGWWVWGICCWIGGGWCVESDNHKRPQRDGTAPGRGVHSDSAHEPKRQLPALSVTTRNGVASGRGVHAAQAYSPGRRPAMTSAGQGVHLPSLGNDRGLNGVSAAPCVEWFRALQHRLRRVRVACGDWQRVLGQSVLGKGKNVGGRRPCAVFLDPPYAHEFRDPDLYSEDDPAVSAVVREWALQHGDDPDLRIALCGYWDEHRTDMPDSWTPYRWKAARGYAGNDNRNREQETIWLSPHCLPLEEAQRELFAMDTFAAPERFNALGSLLKRAPREQGGEL